MHVLLAVLGVLGAGACWWCRIKYMSRAAAEIVDAAERTRGYVRRRQFRKKAEASTIAAIDDPRTAAVLLMVAVASCEGRMSEAAEREIRAAMQDVMDVEKPEEELVFAEWAVSGIADLNNLVFRLSPVWLRRLKEPERRELYGAVKRVAFADGDPDALQLSALQKLRDRLQLRNEVAANC